METEAGRTEQFSMVSEVEEPGLKPLLLSAMLLCLYLLGQRELFVGHTAAACQTTSNLVVWNNSSFILLRDSVGQEFRKGTIGVACVCSVRSGAREGRLEGWRWLRRLGLQASEGSLTSLGVDAGCRLGPQLEHVHDFSTWTCQVC